MKKDPSPFDPKNYWEQRLLNNYDLTGVGHFSLGNAYNSWLYRVRKHVFRNLLSRIPNDGMPASVLDIGSGTGFYIEQWKRAGVRSLAGADLTSVAVKNLQIKYPGAQFYELDITENIIPGKEDQFDVISCFDVLFHIVDDRKYEQAVRNIHAMLRPGGLFLFSDNFLHGGTIRWTHQVSRSLSSIEQILHNTGFSIIDRVPMFVLMNGPVDTRWPGFLALWNIYARILSLSNVIGFAAGALLFPIELLLLHLVRESPTTEIMICRKDPSRASRSEGAHA